MINKSDSVILIPIPEAEEIIGKWRMRYDRVARLGIPAHITLLFPFKIPSVIDKSVINKLELLFSTINTFSFSLTAIETFPNVIFLSPSPKESFIDITKKIVSIFPENQPYEGKFPDINPHLTLGQLSDKDNFSEILKKIKEDIEHKLPLKTKATEARLMIENPDGKWTIMQRFQLCKT